VTVKIILRDVPSGRPVEIFCVSVTCCRHYQAGRYLRNAVYLYRVVSPRRQRSSFLLPLPPIQGSYTTVVFPKFWNRICAPLSIGILGFWWFWCTPISCLQTAKCLWRDALSSGGMLATVQRSDQAKQYYPKYGGTTNLRNVGDFTSRHGVTSQRRCKNHKPRNLPLSCVLFPVQLVTGVPRP
jgi:hypothetical protein